MMTTPLKKPLIAVMIAALNMTDEKCTCATEMIARLCSSGLIFINRQGLLSKSPRVGQGNGPPRSSLLCLEDERVSDAEGDRVGS